MPYSVLPGSMVPPKADVTQKGVRRRRPSDISFLAELVQSMMARHVLPFTQLGTSTPKIAPPPSRGNDPPSTLSTPTQPNADLFATNASAPNLAVPSTNLTASMALPSPTPSSTTVSTSTQPSTVASLANGLTSSLPWLSSKLGFTTPPPPNVTPADTFSSTQPNADVPATNASAPNPSLLGTVSSVIQTPLQQINPSSLVSGITQLFSKPPASGPMPLADYPRPPGDTGRGFDWIPTLHSSAAVVDEFVQKAKSLGASWVVFLNNGTQTGANDYLVKKLVANNIEPIMRIYTDHGSPINGDLARMVQHYVHLGVHYFQPYNEPNLPSENPDGKVSVSSYVNRWIPAAKAIIDGGGLPGIGALAPGAPVDDVSFLRSTFQEIKRRGATDLLNHAWISMHNYTFNRPITYHADSNGFLKFRWYNQVAQDQLGRSLPVISTEGGPRMGDNVDPHYPPVDEARRDTIATDAFKYLTHREPYFFAQTQWLLANQAGGGQDAAWNADALFKANGSPTPLAQKIEAQAQSLASQSDTSTTADTPRPTPTPTVDAAQPTTVAQGQAPSPLPGPAPVETAQVTPTTSAVQAPSIAQPITQPTQSSDYNNQPLTAMPDSMAPQSTNLLLFNQQAAIASSGSMQTLIQNPNLAKQQSSSNPSTPRQPVGSLLDVAQATVPRQTGTFAAAWPASSLQTASSVTPSPAKPAGPTSPIADSMSSPNDSGSTVSETKKTSGTGIDGGATSGLASGASQPAVPAATTPTSVPPEIIRSVPAQVLQQLAGTQLQAGMTLVMQLDPPLLGKVLLRVSSGKGGRIRLHFQVDDATVGDALAGSLDQLTNALRAEGVSPEGVSIGLNTAQMSSDSSGQSGQQQSSHPSVNSIGPRVGSPVEATASVSTSSGHTPTSRYIDYIL